MSHPVCNRSVAGILRVNAGNVAGIDTRLASILKTQAHQVSRHSPVFGCNHLKIFVSM